MWYSDGEKAERERQYQRDFDNERAAEKPAGGRFGFFHEDHAQARPMDSKTYSLWHHVRQACSMLYHELVGTFDVELDELEDWLISEWE